MLSSFDRWIASGAERFAKKLTVLTSTQNSNLKHFLEHEDAFPPTLADENRFQRHATVLLYLDTVETGGETTFSHGDALRLPHADGAVDLFMASALTHELPKQASERLIAEAARTLRTGGVFGYFDLNKVQLLRDNPVSNIVDRVAISNEPFMHEFLEFDLEGCLRANGFEITQISATNKEKWDNWEDCPCRILVAKKL